MWMPDAGTSGASAIRVPVAVTGYGNHTPPQLTIRSHYTMQNQANSSLAGQTQVSPFLSLPGELRNRIYDFCAEDGAVNLPASQSHFGNLRYVCQLIYTEFSSVYLARTAVILEPADVERYLAIYYPGLQAHEPNALDIPAALNRTSTLPGRVRIDVPLGATINLGSFANLRPNKLHFNLVRGNCTNGPLQEASVLLRAIVDSSCSSPFRQIIDVDKILFRYSLMPEVIFRMPRGVTESFSERNPRRRTPIDQTAWWLRQQGLPHMYYLKIVLESSEEVVRSPGMNVLRYRRSRGHTQLLPLDELEGSDAQQAHLAAHLADLNLSQTRSKTNSSSNPST